MSGPQPRPPRVANCALISIYGTSFLLLFIPFMRTEAPFFALKLSAIFLTSLAFHFWVMTKRIFLYRALGRMLGRPIRFFEFPFVALVASLYAVVLFVLPALAGILDLRAFVADESLMRNITVYFLFACAAILVNAAISGFDIYPVNVFGTKEAMLALVSITRDLMKACNHAIVVAVGSILVAWVFEKIDLDTYSIYVTGYGVIGFGLGTTAVLGSRLTELLYRLAELERAGR